nr:uncharacterized protein LOC119186661 [Rhipicephalus microplus]
MHPINQVFLEDLLAGKIITKASSEKSRNNPGQNCARRFGVPHGDKPSWNEINVHACEASERRPSFTNEFHPCTPVSITKGSKRSLQVLHRGQVALMSSYAAA